MPASAFTHVLTVLPSPTITNSVFLNLVPTTVQADELMQAAQQLLERIDEENRGVTLWALLIGGDTAAYKFRKEHYVTLAEAMNELSRRFGIKWLITTSRRTGANKERVLESKLAPENIAYAVYYHQRPEKIIAGYLGLAERIFCTEDSGTMMMEAIASTKPVTTLYADIGHPPLIHQFVVENLRGKRLIERTPIDNLKRYDPDKTALLSRDEVVAFIEREKATVLQLTEGLVSPQD